MTLLKVRVSQDELDSLKAAAEAAGMTVSAYVRHKVGLQPSRQGKATVATNGVVQRQRWVCKCGQANIDRDACSRCAMVRSS